MRMFLSASILLATTSLLAAQNAPRGNVETGKTLYEKVGCYQCHGRAAQGATATGPRLAPNPIAYTRFLSYIRKPAGDMPPYTAKIVTDQQVADIYAFLQTIPKPPAVQDIPLLRQ